MDSQPGSGATSSLPQGHFDAYAPAVVAERVEAAGVAKVRLATLPTLALGCFAGVFIAFGAMFFTVAITDSTLGFGPTRVLGGVCFSLGLVLVVVAGAELFTGNNLVVLAWADGRVTTGELLRNWSLVFLGNAVGALGAAAAVVWAGHLDNAAVAETAARIAAAKVALEPGPAFVRGVLCNALVCLAVWLCFAAHTVSGKVIAIVLPITAFVALGFEHSIANLYLLPVGMLASGNLDPGALLGNLVPVTLGNVAGGGGFVALGYWAVYRRRD